MERYDRWNNVKKDTEKSNIKLGINGMVTNSAMILQLKTYSIKRLMNKAGVINKNDFSEVVEKAKKLFD